MNGLAKAAVRGISALGMLAAVGFGAAQALAAPTSGADANAALRACSSSTCATACFNKGYTHWYCWQGVCHCSYTLPPN